MKRKGVTYDVGTVTGMNWRPDYHPTIVRRELEIIKRDLHCTAVRITGQDLGRLVVAAEDALQQGLEVWLSPVLWNKRPEQTLASLVKSYAGGRHGITYPAMLWEPKESFWAVAASYAADVAPAHKEAR